MKNNNFLRFIINLLQVIMRMTVVVAVVNFVLHGFMRYEKFQTANTFYITVVVLVCYLARVCLKNGKIVFFIHAIAAASPIVMVNGVVEDKLLVFMLSVLVAYYSMKKSDQKPFIQLDMALLVICYIVGSTLISESAFVIPTYCTIIYLISYMIWHNMNSLDRFIAENGEVESFNMDQFINMNSVLLSIFVALCAVAMYIMPRIHLQSAIWAVIKVVLSGVLVVIRQFTKHLPKGGSELEQSIENVITRDVDTTEVPIGLEMTEGNDTLDMIMFIFAFVIVACMAVMLFKALMDRKYQQNKGIDVKEFIKPAFKPVVRFKKQEGVVNDEGPDNVKVRKMYRRLIKKNHKKNKINSSLLPNELSKIAVSDEDQSKKLTRIYEKARYSNEKVEVGEVEFVRKLK